MSKELRQAYRYDVEISAEVYTPNAVIAAQTRNLSDTGVCLDTTVQLDEGHTLGVSLFLVTDGIEDPDAEPLNIKSQVVWSSQRDDGGYSSGLRFDVSDNAVKSALQGFLAQLQLIICAPFFSQPIVT